MKIHNLLDPDFLAEMITQGFVTMTSHPSLPYKILNYTAAAQYAHNWNDVTRQCRGLIYNTETLNVMSRPFPKFFNLGELLGTLPDSAFDGPVSVTAKMDGSLGILYSNPRTTSGWAIATRGSFMSEQALHGTRVLNERYSYTFRPNPNWTYLFEIIYPQNRIVVDYAGMDDLVLLDVLDTETGASVEFEPFEWARFGWPGPVAEAIDIPSINELLTLPQPENFEGYVVRFEDGLRVKVKMDEYVRLHRIVTGVSTKTIWEYLSTGKDVVELLDRVPDEFHKWVQTTTKDLLDQFCTLNADVSKAYYAALEKSGDAGMYGMPSHRKAFASAVEFEPLKAMCFLLYDIRLMEKPYRRLDAAIWKMLQPQFEKPWGQRTEEAA